MEKYREYRILATDPTITDQAAKLYSDKASEYYARAQDAMDEIEPDMTDHLSDEDKALPNVSLADQEKELNNKNTNEMFTKQSRQYDQWADDNDKLKAKKAAKAAELSDKDKAMIKKHEDDEKEQEDSEMNKMDADMYRESIDLERWAKLAGINEGMDATSLMGKYITLSQNVGMSGYHPKTAQDVIDIMPKFQTPGFGIKVHDTDPGRASFGNAVYLVQQDGSLKMVSDNYDTSG
jgi:primosomal protein N'